MSVLIKGIEMPTGHGELTLKVWPSGRVEIINEAGEWKTSEAVPIPPHGRLIDADKLGIRDAEKQAYDVYLLEKGEDFIEEPVIEYLRGYLEGLTHASGRVRFAPTIIPAEEET